jgi:flagellum-specific peptidoglycan hydrolase FlgJ
MGATSDYIAKYSNDMIDACYNTGLYPSVMMAQGILESANGQSLLSAKYNNHFGIKAMGFWLGAKVLLDTTEEVKGKKDKIQANFRTYPNSFDGFVDRVNFLKSNPRYTKAGVFTAKTPEAQAKALQAAGYATESTYANKLINIINTFNLKSLDAVVPNKFRATTRTKMIGVGIVIVALSSYIYIRMRLK